MIELILLAIVALLVAWISVWCYRRIADLRGSSYSGASLAQRRRSRRNQPSHRLAEWMERARRVVWPDPVRRASTNPRPSAVVKKPWGW